MNTKQFLSSLTSNCVILKLGNKRYSCRADIVDGKIVNVYNGIYNWELPIDEDGILRIDVTFIGNFNPIVVIDYLTTEDITLPQPYFII